MDRDFVASAPNRCWVADFRHATAFAGVVYIAFVVDTFSRRVVGWSAATTKETRLVLDALEMALWQRDRDQRPVIPGELFHHSDAGSQYTSFRLAEHSKAAGIAASIGSVGDACDNALMESVSQVWSGAISTVESCPTGPGQRIGSAAGRGGGSSGL